MEFRALGPLEVVEGDHTLPLGGPKQRTVLAHLVLQASRLVTVTVLIDALWGEEPPESARNTLQTYIKRLRKVLGPGLIEHVSSGYVLRAESCDVDVLRFEAFVDKAHGMAPRDLPGAAQALRQALSLWRGPALNDLSDQESLRPEVSRLEEMRLAALDDRIEADLNLGRHHDLMPELETLVAHHPYRERAWSHLMTALYRSGRQGDALAAYQRARERLGEDLGIDPSPELQALHQQILAQDPALELAGEMLRGYRLLEPLGEGAFGLVHRAFQPEVGREVAIKVIHPRLANDPEFIRRFDAEAQLVARLEHPHIVPVYDYWRDPEGAYLVMRYLRGGNLRQALAGGPLDTTQVLTIADQVAQALGAAHRLGVIHRDVQPANILFDDEGNTYLSDFGIARDLAVSAGGHDPRASRSFAYYLSPEEARGDTPTGRADIYGLGLVLRECLTGERGADERQGTERPELPTAVDRVIARATAVDPRERYPDAPALAAALREALTDVAPTPPYKLDDYRNPYKGLRPFLEADASDYFGRETTIEELLGRIADANVGSRFLAVIGPSGSGKSSLVRAGLIPALRDGGIPGSDGWFFVDMLPGEHPFEGLAAACERIAIDPRPGLRERLERDAGGLRVVADEILPPGDCQLVVLIDQFEEVFTRVQTEATRARFLDAVVATATDPRSRVRVVITLRADFYDRPLLYKDFGDLVTAHAVALTPLSIAELDHAISVPAQSVGVTLEPGLTSEVITDVVDRPGGLPLLQYALTELFERRRGATLTLEAYRSLGGVAGTLARTAEELYGTLNESAREAARQLFLRLVELGTGGLGDTRRRVPRSNLASLELEHGPMDEAIDIFAARRLLSFDRDPETRGPTVEVAHEALLTQWGRLRGWIESAREDLRTERRLASATEEWTAGGRDTSFLLRGSRLEGFASWGASTSLALAAPERAYLDASIEHASAERAAEEQRRAREAALERRSTKRLRGLVAVLALAALIATTLTVVANDQRARAGRQARIATAQGLAAAANSAMDADSERALLLAIEAVETTRRVDGTVLPEAEEALHAAVQADRLVLTVPGYIGTFDVDGTRILAVRSKDRQRAGLKEVGVYDAQTGELLESAAVPGLNEAAFSQDGRRFVTSDWNDEPAGDAHVWRTATGNELQRLSLPDESLDGRFAFSPDGRLLSVFTGNLHTDVFDLHTGTSVNDYFLTGPSAFSPDGQQLLIADNYLEERQRGVGLIAKHDLLHGDPRADLLGNHTLLLHDSGVTSAIDSVDWSSDGATMAASAFDRAWVWDAKTRDLLRTLAPPTGVGFTAVDLGSGRRIVTGLSDGTAIVWALSPDGVEQILTVAGHDGRVRSVSLSPDGNRLMTAGGDGSIKVWDITPRPGAESLTLLGSDALAFSPDGQLLAIGDGTDINLFDASTGERLQVLSGTTDNVSSVAFSPDGTLLASGSINGWARIWNVASGVQVTKVAKRITSVDQDLRDLAFSPDGTVLATSGRWPDEDAHLWDTTTGELVRVLSDNSDAPDLLSSVDFSPDGALIAADGDSDIYVWSAQDGSHLATIPQSFTHGLTFSPDGERLVTGSDDGIGFWDVHTGAFLHSVTGNPGSIIDLAFNPDGTKLATSSTDGTIRLWDGQTGAPVLSLATDATGKLAFSPDGARLAYTATGGRVRVLALDIDDLLQIARRTVGRSFTLEECQQYLHVETCPTAST